SVFVARTTCWPTSRWTERDDDMNATVKDMMTTEVVAVRRETTFKEMAAVLRRYRVSALPVVDDAGRVLGVVSEADLLAKEALSDPGPVAELVRRKDLRKAEGLTAGDLMTSPPVTATRGRALIRTVRYVPGVVAVRDRLSYPDVYPVVAGPVF